MFLCRKAGKIPLGALMGGILGGIALIIIILVFLLVLCKCFNVKVSKHRVVIAILINTFCNAYICNYVPTDN